MSETTNLKLFKHDNPETNTEKFNVDKALNENWDKIDEGIGAIIAENERLKQDLNGLPTGQAEGESIDITDSAEMRFSSFKISGNSKQETREGYNFLDESKLISATSNGVTISYSNKKIKLSGTCTLASGQTQATYIPVTLEKGNYIFSCFGNFDYEYFTLRDDSNTFIQNLMQYNNTANQNREITATETTIYRIAIHIEAGKTYNNEINLMINEGTEEKEYEQYGASPSPDYPSEVESCGDNVDLIPTDESEWEQGTISDGNLQDSTTRIRTKNYCPINVLKQTISMASGQNYVYGNINYYKSDKTYINNQYILSGNKDTNFTELTFTPPEGTAYFKVVIKKADDSTILASEISNIKPKLEKGSKATPYSPYGQGCINEGICNKNLAKKCSGIWYDTNSHKYMSNSVTYGFVAKVKPNTTYTISKKNQGNRFIIVAGAEPVEKGNSFTRVVFASNHTITNYTFTTQENEYYVFLGVHNGTNTSEIALAVEDVQIEEGTVSTDYVEHKKQVFTISTQQPMRTIGDVRDTFVKINNKWHERHYIDIAIYDGSDNSWFKDTTINRFYNYTLPSIPQKNISNGTIYNLLCNMDVKSSPNLTYSKNNGITIDKTGWIHWYNEGIADLTVEELNNMLKEENLIIQYPLATPIDIECTEEQARILDEIDYTVKSYKGVTHILSTDEVGAYVEVVYRKDLESRLVALEAAILN